MIAQVYVPDEEAGYLLTLEDSGRWASMAFPEVADAFNALHAGTFTESNGPDGVWQANDAASKLNGEVTYLKS